MKQSILLKEKQNLTELRVSCPIQQVGQANWLCLLWQLDASKPVTVTPFKLQIFAYCHCHFLSRSAQIFRREVGRWWKIRRVEWDLTLIQEISGSRLTMQPWSDTSPTLFAAWAWVEAWSGHLISMIFETLAHVNRTHCYVPLTESSEVTWALDPNVISMLTVPQ
jgi:hypothetical protein